MADEKGVAFWVWFRTNEEMLFEFERDRERVFDLLQAELQKVDSRLAFEFGPIRDGIWREFVISADGIRDAFPAVERLFAQAPTLDRWKFVKFRPRHRPMIISMHNRDFDPAEVHFRLFRDGAKIGIMLFFESYNDQERRLFAQIGYLMLDQALGEFTVETEVGFIDFADRTSKFFDIELPLPLLAHEFDAALINE